MPLDKNQKLYRFISFYDAYDILIKKRLRLSKLSTFSDKNEGVGSILRGQDYSLFRLFYLKNEDIKKTYNNAQQNNYVSCWTQESDMIAMWAIYSEDKTSIRISTTVEKLHQIFQTIFEKMHWRRLSQQEIIREQTSNHYAIEEVDYVDFIELRDSIRNKCQEYDKKLSSLSKEHDDFYNSDRYFEESNKFLDSQIIKKDGMFLKDRAYFHECEVRAVLYTGITTQEKMDKWLNQDSSSFSISDHTPIEYTGEDELPNYIYADLPCDFIEDICFDPRMPQYKRKIFEEMFSHLVSSISESKAFGKILEQEDFESDYDGYPIKT